MGFISYLLLKLYGFSKSCRKSIKRIFKGFNITRWNQDTHRAVGNRSKCSYWTNTNHSVQQLRLGEEISYDHIVCADKDNHTLNLDPSNFGINWICSLICLWVWVFSFCISFSITAILKVCLVRECRWISCQNLESSAADTCQILVNHTLTKTPKDYQD